MAASEMPCEIRSCHPSAGDLVLFLDRKIQRDVVAQLEWEPGLLDDDIVVRVHGGVVTLRGFVDRFGSLPLLGRLTRRRLGVENPVTPSPP
jgi:BON domain